MVLGVISSVMIMSFRQAPKNSSAYQSLLSLLKENPISRDLLGENVALQDWLHVDQERGRAGGQERGELGELLREDEREEGRGHCALPGVPAGRFVAIHGGLAGQRREARLSVQVACFLEQTHDKAESFQGQFD